MKPQVLRQYQTDAIGALREKMREGEKRLLLVSPAGSGKTTISSEIIRSAVARGRRVLFLAHRRELLQQCGRRLDGFGVEHGIIQADHPQYLPWMPVQVASVPTLVRRLAILDRYTDTERAWLRFGLVIVDEAHHAAARSYGRILDQYPDAITLGLTATPWRTDGKGLGRDGLFRDVVLAAEPADLIRHGYLVGYDGWAFHERGGPDLEGVRTTGGDFNADDLARKQRDKKILGRVVDEWLARSRDKLTIVFACTVEHSRELAAEFRMRGVTAEHVDAETPEDERDAILGPEGRFPAGRTRVLCNVGIMTEGFDCPAASCIVLTRATQSIALALQMLGRGMRPVPCACGCNFDWHLPGCPRCGAPPRKTCCWIHDHAGILMMHGPPDAKRDYSLTADESRKAKGASEKPPALRQCLTDANGPGCYRVFPASVPVCPGCGKAVAGKERRIREVDADAVPIREVHEVEWGEKRAEWDRLVGVAAASGYMHGWCLVTFKARFGHAPPWKWTQGAKARFQRDTAWQMAYARKIAGRV